jgi:two-component system sensor histidine kinase CiaH
MFTQARIKLTIWYISIIMVVTGLFSVAMYEILSKEVRRFSNLQEERWELSQQPSNSSMSPRYLHVLVPRSDPRIERELLERIRIFLLFINGVVLITSGILAYVLAGKTLEPIKKNMEQQQQFVSDAGHELKTPLTAVGLGIEVALRDKQLSLREAKEVLQNSWEEIAVLQTVTQSLLSLSTGEWPQSYFGQVRLAEVVKKALKKMKPLADQKQITLHTQVAELEIKGVATQIVELLVILIDNAIKYSATNTTIQVQLVAKRRAVCITVVDQGVGIAPVDLPHVFDRFYRVDQSRTKTGVGGHGLGLAIAQRIVQAHHGNITVSSKIGQGTKFVVTLPA